MINKSYKIWIILFVIINLLLLIWSLGYFKFFEEKLAKKDDIIVIEPDNQFKKSLPPKDESFPNEKSKIWGAFEDKKSPEQILQRNTKEENQKNEQPFTIIPDQMLFNNLSKIFYCSVQLPLEKCWSFFFELARVLIILVLTNA